MSMKYCYILLLCVVCIHKSVEMGAITPVSLFYRSPPHLISLLLRLPPFTSLHSVEFKGHAIIVLKRGSFGSRLVPKFTFLLLLCVGFCGLYNIPHSLQTTTTDTSTPARCA